MKQQFESEYMVSEVTKTGKGYTVRVKLILNDGRLSSADNHKMLSSLKLNQWKKIGTDIKASSHRDALKKALFFWYALEKSERLRA